VNQKLALQISGKLGYQGLALPPTGWRRKPWNARRMMWF
jgi:hypothetical protein